MSGFTLSYDMFGKLITTDEGLLGVFDGSIFSFKELNTLGRSMVNLSSIGTMSLLFYRLLKIEFERCVRTETPIILVETSLAQKAVDHFFHQTCSAYVTRCLAPSIIPILDLPDAELDLVEFDPTKFPIDLGLDEIEKHIENAVESMNDYMHQIAGSIFSEKSSRILPVTVKSVIRFVQEFAQAFEMDEAAQIGSFLICRLCCRVVSFPEKWGIGPSDGGEISRPKRKVLNMVSETLRHLALQTRFDADDASMEPLNHNIDELETFASIFLKAVGSTKDFLSRMHVTHSRVLDENMSRQVVLKTESLIRSAAYIHQQLLDKKVRILDEVLSQSPVSEKRKILAVLSVLGEVKQCDPEEEIEDPEEEAARQVQEEEAPPAPPPPDPDDEILGVTRAERKYLEYMERARTMTFSEFEHAHAIQFVGHDTAGRQIVLCKEPVMFDREQNEKFLYYILWKMEEVTKSEYTLVVCLNRNTDRRRAKRPGMGWFKNAYKILPRRYKKNMKHFFLVHPNLLVSILMKVLGPLLSRKVFRKVHNCGDLRMIYGEIVSPDECRLPASVIQFNIDKYQRGKGILPENPVYGVPLPEMLQHPSNAGELVPLFHRRLIAYMAERQKTVGIYRKAGNTLVINQVKDALNYRYPVDFAFCDFHSVCGAWKLWFRDLPEPLIPSSMYRHFLASAPPRAELRAASGKKCLRLFQQLAETEKERYHLCVALFRFLHSVSKESDTNLMTCGNLAIVFGPNVLRTPSLNPMAVLKDSPRVTAVTEAMIMYAHRIFPDDIETLKAKAQEPQLDPSAPAAASSPPSSEVESEGEAEAPKPQVDAEQVTAQRRRRLGGTARRVQRRMSHRSSNIGAMELTMLQFALAQTEEGKNG